MLRNQTVRVEAHRSRRRRSAGGVQNPVAKTGVGFEVRGFCRIVAPPMTSALPSFQPGDRLLGKYVVERVLGAGAMGSVLSVRHGDLGELFAIKVMKPHALIRPDAVERFQREARAAAKLQSEHAVKVHDVGRLEDGTPYMMMEHLSGRDLAAVLEADGSLPLAAASSYLLQALAALAEAHGMGVVHRDIKPANLFLAERANGSVFLKVLDFGVAKHAKVDVAMDLTKTQAVLGSPFYMSPEQMASPRSVDRRTDIWAVGVTLYQLTTGRLPFVADTIAQLVQRVISQQPVPPSQLSPSLPRELDAVVQRCLAKHPDHRYPSCEELADALAPFAQTTSKSTPPIQAAPVAAFGAQSRTELFRSDAFAAASPILAQASTSGSDTIVMAPEPPPPPPPFVDSAPVVVVSPAAVASALGPVEPLPHGGARVAAPVNAPAVHRAKWLLAVAVALLFVAVAVFALSSAFHSRP
jgi:serine/threonine-protein kinase